MNAWLNEYAWLWQLAGWTMIHFLWIGAVAAVIGGAVRLACRRAAPNVRYTASLATLAVLAAAPMAIVAWLAEHSPAILAGAPVSVTNVEAPVLLAPGDSPSQDGSAIYAPGAVIDLADADPPPSFATAHSDFVIPAPDPSFVIPHSDFVIPLNALVPYLPAAWLVGAPLTFLLLAAGLVGSQRLRRTCTPLVAGPAYDACRRLRTALGMTCHVSLAVCDRTLQPVLIGIARPLILLPAAALAGWSPQELEMVLLHELAHVRRWDNLVNLLQRLVESALFFHPAVWLASRQVRRDREECCDAIVVARTEQPREYAELLVSIAAKLPARGLWRAASSQRAGSLAAASAMADHPLAGRLRRILKLENEPMRVSPKTIAAALAVPLILATAALYAVAEGDDETSKGREQPSTVASGDRAQGGSPREATKGGIEPAYESPATEEQPTTPANDDQPQTDPPRETTIVRSNFPPNFKQTDAERARVIERLKQQGYNAKAIVPRYGNDDGIFAMEIEVPISTGQKEVRVVWEEHPEGMTCRVIDPSNDAAHPDAPVLLPGAPYPQAPTDAPAKPTGEDAEPSEKQIADLQRQVEVHRNEVAFWNTQQDAALKGRLDAEQFVDVLASQTAYNDPRLKELQRRLNEANEKVRVVMEGTGDVPDDLGDFVRALRESRISYQKEFNAVVEDHRKRLKNDPDLVLESAIKARAKAVRTLKETEAKLAAAEERVAKIAISDIGRSGPVVLETSPASNEVIASDVQEIRITFNKPMQDGSWSWSTADEGEFPKTTGKPRYLEDGRTCVLPVALEQNKHYAIWINDEKHKNFKDRSGRPAEPFLLQFRTSAERAKGRQSDDPSALPEVSVMQWPQSTGGQTTAYLKIKFEPIAQEIEKQVRHLALVRSPRVIEHALQAPEVKDAIKYALMFLLEVDAYGDFPSSELVDREMPKLVNYVAERVKASFPGGGEILELRIESDESLAESDRKLLTALINAYLAEVKTAGGGDTLAREEAAQAARPVFRYDGKTFDEWRSQWKHELKIERRIEAIDALAAFARAGRARDAAEAIFDVAGEYDYPTVNLTVGPEGKIRLAILKQFWSALPASVWLPQLKTRMDADPSKWRPLFDATLRPDLFGGRLSLDKDSSALLASMAADPKYAPNAPLLWVLLRSKSGPQIDQLIKAALTGDDAQNAAQMLEVLGFRDLNRFPEQFDLLLDDDPKASHLARYALADAKGGELEAIASRLWKILEDPDQSAKHADAVRALGVLQEHQSRKGEVNAENPHYSKATSQKVWQALMSLLKDGPVELLPPVLVALGGDSPEYARSMTTGDQLSPERKAEIETAFEKYPEELKLVPSRRE